MPVIPEKLEELSIEALYTLAEKMGLGLPPDLDKFIVIGEILDAYLEDSMERKIATTVAIHVEEKKFSGSELDEIEASLVAAPSTIARYNETVIHLIVKDSGWAFVFWDISVDDFNKYGLGEQMNGLALHVQKIDLSTKKVLTSFDVAVSLQDNSWYINLPDPDSDYRVQLMAVSDAGKVEICHSGIVHTPRAWYASTEELFEAIHPELYELSGAESLNLYMMQDYHPSRIMPKIDD